MALINLVFIYSIIYILFYFMGYSILILRSQSNSKFIHNLIPLVGMSLFLIITTILMYNFTGNQSGFIAGIILIIFSSITIIVKKRFNILKDFLSNHSLSFLAGLIFLLPLILSNEYGIFALNGADFGSYVGWGSYFADKTLLDGRPSVDAINSTLNGFANLQEELSKPNSAWRVANVSFFAALNAFFNENLWPSAYMSFVGFIVAHIVISLKLFTRYVLSQSWQSAKFIAVSAILLNTIYWLGMSHYTPNLMGIILTMIILSTIFNRYENFLLKVLLLTFFLAAMIVIYPESILFIVLLTLFFYVYKISIHLIMIYSGKKTFLLNFNVFKQIYFKETYKTIVPLLLAILLAILVDYNSISTITRHFIVIFNYERPGDYVGIFKWSYFSQLLGFSDYNDLLRQYPNKFIEYLTFCGYFISIVIIFLFIKDIKKQTNFIKSKSLLILSIPLMILFFMIPILKYWYTDSLLLVWRSFITLSPYVWIFISLISFLYISKTYSSNFTRKIVIYLYIFFILISLIFRFFMLSYIINEGEHSLIFKKVDIQNIKKLNKIEYELLFIEYEGTGTVQAGWELYCQKLPFIFPEHGSGRNEYDDKILQDKIVAVIVGNYPKVAKLVKFDDEENVHLRNNSNVLFTNKDNIFLTYSSSWIYMKNNNSPLLILPGLPGKLLFWSQEDVNANLKFDAHTNRKSGELEVTIDESKFIYQITNENQSISINFNFKKGLNIIRFVPLDMSNDALKNRESLLKNILDKEKPTEYEKALLNIYSDSFFAKNPLFSAKSNDWNGIWNLVTPDDKFPLHPHIIFNNIELEKAK